MLRISRRLCGPGHSSCKEMSVATSDGPSRHMRFRLRRINHDFGRVLCMADSKKLRQTSGEILGEVIKQGYCYDLLTDGASTAATSLESHIKKSKSFWTVFSKRFKASLPILSARDIVQILRAFDVAKQDTGVYVAAVLPLRQRIDELDKNGLINALHVLSRRLKKNTQKELFSSLANHLPNVLWEMNATDIAAFLWCLSQAGHRDTSIAEYVQPKFCKIYSTLNDLELGSAALAFARHGHSDVLLFNHIRQQFPLQCTGEALFRLSWGLHMAGVEFASLLHDNLGTCLEHVRTAERHVVEIWRHILRNTDLYTEVFQPSQQNA